MTRKHIEVVAAIIKKGNAILATQRGYGDLKDGWEFPGGKIELGEAHTEALIREIKEELEANINVGEQLITVNYALLFVHINRRRTCYIVRTRSS